MHGTHSSGVVGAKNPPVVLCSAANRFATRHFDAEKNRPKPHTG